ncbi:MAG: MmgE/PrpD family protein [Pseudomonadota bacterium]
MSSTVSSLDAARVMARHAALLSFGDLPAPAVEASRCDLLDTLGVAIAGWKAPGCAEVRALVLEQYPSGSATVWSSGRQAPPAEAALANGTMAHALDFDDTHDASVLHAGVSVIPAALAVAEHVGGVSGKELLAAITVGIDWVCRMGMAATIGPVASGWMYTSLFGHFGATAAAGRLLKLSEQQMEHAIGIAFAQAAGNTQCMIDGSLTKRMQPGFAARGGILSAMLARSGITGTIGTFDGPAGLYRICLNGNYDRDTLLRDLGSKFLGTELSYKPYPACRYTHTAIEATLALAQRHAIDPATIESIEVGTNENAYRNVSTPLEVKTRPRSVVDAQFSIPYCVAAALVRGQVFIDDFHPEAFADETVLRIAAKVRPFADPEIQASHPRDISPATVAIRLKDGRVLSCRQDSAKGGADNPMSFDELADKFRRCARYAGLPEGHGRTERLVDMVSRVDELADVRELARAISGDPHGT